MRQPVTKPEITLTRWLVIRVCGADDHLIGMCLGTGKARVSSKIVHFDRDTMTCLTASGRLYILNQDPCLHLQALYTFQDWAAHYGIQNWKAVSDEYCLRADEDDED